MIFDGRAVDQIGDDEIVTLIKKHVSEKQFLEFKATFEHKKDTARAEVLRDIVAMANGGGGYIIIGVRDDGHGRAQAFAEPSLMRDPEAMIRSIRSLCHEHIAEQIEGIELRHRDLNGNTVIIVRVPVSGRRPHMVTFKHQTGFLIRVEDGKREMSLGEIREGFIKAPMGMRLDSIEARVSDLFRTLTRSGDKERLTEALRWSASDALVRTADGDVFAEVMRERFEAQVGESPFLWLSATAVTPRPRLVPLDEPKVDSILSDPPGSRPNGWNMADLDYRRRRSMNAVELGAREHKYLEVYENGHVEFWTPISDLFCWMQSPEEQKIDRGSTHMQSSSTPSRSCG